MMYKILSQICLSLTGENLPEEVYDNNLFYYLQGSRLKRNVLVDKINTLYLMTPYQLMIAGWPNNMYFCNNLLSTLSSGDFASHFYKNSNGYRVDPVYTSAIKWLSHSYLDVPFKNFKVILYFQDQEDRDDAWVNFIYKSKGILDYKLQPIDISYLSSCVICNHFSYKRSEKFRTTHEDYHIINRNFHSYKNDEDGPYICSQCRESKARQEKYRLRMYDPDFGKDRTPKEIEFYHQGRALEIEKPIVNIPSDWKSKNKTPLDCVNSYYELIDDCDKYWHPELTSDEYIYYIENI